MLAFDCESAGNLHMGLCMGFVSVELLCDTHTPLLLQKLSASKCKETTPFNIPT